MAEIDDLIRQAPKDEPMALNPRVCEALMQAHYDFVYHLASAFLGDPDEADDAAQETFLQAALHIDQYHCGSSLKSWIGTIAINICRARYRKRKARQRLEQVLKIVTFQMSATLLSPEDTLLCNEQQRMVRQAVDSLDEKHRLPVLLRYVNGLSVPEIAEMLDEKEGTVYSRLHYAHRQLRGKLQRVEDISERQAGAP